MAVSAKGALRSVEDFLFAPHSILPAVFCRIVFGFTLFVCYLNRAPDLTTVYGARGLSGPAWHQTLVPPPHGSAPFFQTLDSIVPFNDLWLWLAWALLMVASFGFMVGWRTRTCGVIALAMHIFFVRLRMPFATWGWAQQLFPLLLYTILADPGRVLSVDARRRPPTQEDWYCPAWPIRLLQVNTATMYLLSAGARIDDAGWLNGRATWIAVTNALHSKLTIDWGFMKPVLELATWGTLVLEAMAPVFMWLPRIGYLWAYGLIAMHVGLELLSNVGWWSWIQIAALTSFLPASHLYWMRRGWVPERDPAAAP